MKVVRMIHGMWFIFTIADEYSIFRAEDQKECDDEQTESGETSRKPILRYSNSFLTFFFRR